MSPRRVAWTLAIVAASAAMWHQTRQGASNDSLEVYTPSVDAMPATADAPWPPVATFSILGYDPETREVGGAVQSRVFSVGNGVLWAEANVGVVATQAIVDVSYGPQGIELLRSGMAPADVVATILANDPNPRPERWTIEGRQ